MTPLEGSLKDALQRAMTECVGDREEEGGVIVVNGENYEFIKLRNQHTGTATAVALFDGDRQEYGEKVISKFDAGYKNFASFHTHPTGCGARPSHTDLTRLFTGFPVNFIWSPSLKELCRYDWEGVESDCTTWGARIINLI